MGRVYFTQPVLRRHRHLSHTVGLCSYRDRAAALHKALRDLTALSAIVDRDRRQKSLKGREKFSKAFPHLKAEVVGHISQLHTLADQAEELHRGCTISNVVAGSFSAASAILELLGLFLAPVTAEGSLVL